MNKRLNWNLVRASAAAMMMFSVHSAFAISNAVEEAQSLMSQGKYDQALSRLDSQLKSQPQDAEARFTRGLVLVQLNRSAEAIKVFADLTRDYPQLPEPYNNLAVLYAQQGDYEKARDALEAALATHPSYATAHENLGDIYAALAGAAYNRALTLDASNQTVRSKLALIGQLNGKGGTSIAAAAPPTTVTTPPPATPVPTVPSVTTVPSSNGPADADTSKQAISVVNAWASTWSTKDVASYFAIYSPDFVPEGGLSRSAWEQQRRERISRAKRISVRAGNPKVERADGGAVAVEFTQHYESDSFTDEVVKVLELKKAGDSWLITREYTR